MNAYIPQVCRRSGYLIPLLTFSFLLALAAPGLAKTGNDELFQPVKSGLRVPVPAEALNGQAQSVRIRVEQLLRPRLRLSLPDGQSFVAVRDSLTRESNGNIIWTGRLVGEPLSRVTFAARNGVVSGVIDRAMTDGNVVYELVPQRNGSYLLFRLNEESLPTNEPSYDSPIDVLRPKLPSTDGRGRNGKLDRPSRTTENLKSNGSGVEILDIMVVYTTASRNRYGVSGIESRILLAIADANTGFENSLINARLNLVHMAEVNYVETGDITTSLMALRSPTDGHMDEVHGMRNKYGADLVCLISEDSNAAGMAYLMTSLNPGFESYAFSTVYSSALAVNTLAHEVGHNMGAQHNREHSSYTGVYPYSYGWRKTATDGTGFRTVMSNSGVGTTRINYFSNPNLYYMGSALGVDYDTHPDTAADNARTLNNTAAFVASFRTLVADEPAAEVIPIAPTNLTVVSSSTSHVALGWTDNADNETVYYVERSADNGATFTTIASLPSNTTSHEDGTVLSNTSYTFRVRAGNSSGTSSPSNSVNFTVPEGDPAPAAPYAVLAAVLDQGQVLVDWVPGDALATSFIVERATGAGSFSQVASLSAASPSYTDWDVSSGPEYHFRISASNLAGESDYSEIASVVTPSGPPSAPTNLKATALNGSSIRLDWTDTSNTETGFTLYRYNGSAWELIALLDANTTQFTDQGLNRNTRYHYFVAAYNGSGSSQASNVASARTSRK